MIIFREDGRKEPCTLKITGVPFRKNYEPGDEAIIEFREDNTGERITLIIKFDEFKSIWNDIKRSLEDLDERRLGAS